MGLHRGYVQNRRGFQNLRRLSFRDSNRRGEGSGRNDRPARIRNLRALADQVLGLLPWSLGKPELSPVVRSAIEAEFDRAMGSGRRRPPAPAAARPAPGNRCRPGLLPTSYPSTRSGPSHVRGTRRRVNVELSLHIDRDRLFPWAGRSANRASGPGRGLRTCSVASIGGYQIGPDPTVDGRPCQRRLPRLRVPEDDFRLRRRRRPRYGGGLDGFAGLGPECFRRTSYRSRAGCRGPRPMRRGGPAGAASDRLVAGPLGLTSVKS